MVVQNHRRPLLLYPSLLVPPSNVLGDAALNVETFWSCSLNIPLAHCNSAKHNRILLLASTSNTNISIPSFSLSVV